MLPNKGDLEYFHNTGKDYEMHHLKKRLESFENGDAFIKERERGDRWRRKYEALQSAHKAALRKAELEKEKAVEKATKATAKIWQDAADAEHKEWEKESKRAAKLEQRVEQLTDRVAELEAELAKKNADNGKLKRACRKNSLNSGFTSAQDRPDTQKKNKEERKRRRHKRNSRKETGKSKGGQPGHVHHARRRLEPTEPVVVLTEQPSATIGEEGWYKTDRLTKIRDLVDIEVRVTVTPYQAAIWRNRNTGMELHSDFPYDMPCETNYGPELQTMILYLTQQGNMAEDKVIELLEEATDGKLKVSGGWVDSLLKKFAHKAEPDVREIFATVMDSDLVTADTTVTWNDGQREAISVAAVPGKAAYFSHTARKGKTAVESLPINSEAVVVSDREAAFLAAGGKHQLCCEHLRRDIQTAKESEPKRPWQKMYDLLTTLIVAHTDLMHSEDADKQFPTEQTEKWKGQYDQIVAELRASFIKRPPAADYLDGYALMRLFQDEKENVLRFLDDPRIPPTNNSSESLFRPHKRKLHAMMTFRAGEYIDYHAAFLTIARTATIQGERMYPRIRAIMSRKSEAIARV